MGSAIQNIRKIVFFLSICEGRYQSQYLAKDVAFLHYN